MESVVKQFDSNCLKFGSNGWFHKEYNSSKFQSEMKENKNVLKERRDDRWENFSSGAFLNKKALRFFF